MPCPLFAPVRWRISEKNSPVRIETALFLASELDATKREAIDRLLAEEEAKLSRNNQRRKTSDLELVDPFAPMRRAHVDPPLRLACIQPPGIRQQGKTSA